MCIFCVGDDAPFYLRKSTAFPGKLIAEAVDPTPCEKAKSVQLASEADVETAQLDHLPNRTPEPGRNDDNV